MCATRYGIHIVHYRNCIARYRNRDSRGISVGVLIVQTEASFSIYSNPGFVYFNLHLTTMCQKYTQTQMFLWRYRVFFEMKLKLGLHSSLHSNCNLHSIRVHLIPNFHAFLDHCMTQYHSFFNSVKKLNPSFIYNLRSWVIFRWQTNLVYFSHSFWWCCSWHNVQGLHHDTH